MKHSRIILIIMFMFLFMAAIMSACGSAATAGPVTLVVTGMVGTPLNLTDADLHAMKVSDVTADQPKVGSQNFRGVHLSDLLAKAQVKTGAAILAFSASDNYSAQIDLATVNSCSDCMVAFTNTAGSYLLVMPGQAGKVWVKNLIKMEVK